jgi:beta-fructofuranosidase
MWECPDFFQIDNKEILIVSPQEMEAKGLEFHSGNGCIYFIGQSDRVKNRFEREYVSAIDFGLDFYAPQTIEYSDGRRVMIAWMQSWDNYMTPHNFKWSGMMTLPRELSLKDNKLIQVPVREIENYWADTVEYSSQKITNSMKLKGIEGRVIDLEMNILSGDYDSFEVLLAQKGENHIKVSFDPRKNIVKFDRKYSSQRKDCISEREMIVERKNGQIKFRFILDKFSLELFVNDGEQVMTSLYFMDLDADGIEFIVDGELTADIVNHHIKR